MFATFTKFNHVVTLSMPFFFFFWNYALLKSMFLGHRPKYALMKYIDTVLWNSSVPIDMQKQKLYTHFLSVEHQVRMILCIHGGCALTLKQNMRYLDKLPFLKLWSCSVFCCFISPFFWWDNQFVVVIVTKKKNLFVDVSSRVTKSRSHWWRLWKKTW